MWLFSLYLSNVKQKSWMSVELLQLPSVCRHTCGGCDPQLAHTRCKLGVREGLGFSF